MCACVGRGSSVVRPCLVSKTSIWETVGWGGRETERAVPVTGEKGLGWRLRRAPNMHSTVRRCVVMEREIIMRS